MLGIGEIDVEFDFMRSEKITEQMAKDLGLIIDPSEQERKRSKIMTLLLMLEIMVT